MLQTDDFQSGTSEGWTDGVLMSPTVQTTGGPAGIGDAFLMISTSSPIGPGSKLATFNTGPDWVGDYANLNASSVTVDLMNPTGSSMVEMRLVLFGPLNTSQRWTSTISTAVLSDSIWRNYEFSLAEEELTSVGSASNYGDMIDSVVRIMLRHDMGAPSNGGTPVSASLGIDNVSLVAGSPLLPADFDGDGDVDSEDLARWEGDFGANGNSDADGDLDSDGADFLVWQQQFSNGVPPIAASQTVPESSTVVLLGGLAAVSILARCRRCAV